MSFFIIFYFKILIFLTNLDWNNYQQHNYFYNNLDISNLKIILSISSPNILRFLGKYLKLSGFIAGMISNIINNNENEINLKGDNIENYNGTLTETISTILNCYRQSTFKVFVGLSAKGIFGGFLNLFKNDSTDIRDNFKLRNRIPRAFYGNFFSIRKYDGMDAYIIDMINNFKFKIHEQFDYRYLRYLKCEKILGDDDKEYLFIITTKNLIIYNKSDEKCEEILEFIFIEEANLIEENIIYIKFNQSMDGVN